MGVGKLDGGVVNPEAGKFFAELCSNGLADAEEGTVFFKGREIYQRAKMGVAGHIVAHFFFGFRGRFDYCFTDAR